VNVSVKRMLKQAIYALLSKELGILRIQINHGFLITRWKHRYLQTDAQTDIRVASIDGKKIIPKLPVMLI
jgi:hypothetical protein